MVVTPEDYILGMSDLTGELMRYATNGESLIGSCTCRSLIAIALSTGDHETPLAVCEFVRVVKSRKFRPYPRACSQLRMSDFDAVPSWMLYKLSKKQEETNRSLEKIERGRNP